MDNQNSKSKKILMDVPVTRTSLRVIDNIIYSQHYEKGTISLHMTLIIPRTNEPKPCVVYFPGGGFTTSDYSKFIECRMGLARAGFVVAAVQYRTIPNAFPALLEDGKQAIRFLKANAEKFGIDKTRFGVMGNSAGGYLSSMIATTMNEPRFDQGQYLNESSDVQACCTIFGPSDLETIDEGFPTEVQAYHDSRAASEALLVNGVVYGRDPGHLLEEIPDKARAASPLGHIHPGLPPLPHHARQQRPHGVATTERPSLRGPLREWDGGGVCRARQGRPWRRPLVPAARHRLCRRLVPQPLAPIGYSNKRTYN